MTTGGEDDGNGAATTQTARDGGARREACDPRDRGDGGDAGDGGRDDRPPWERHRAISLVTALVLCGPLVVAALSDGDVRLVASGCFLVCAGALTVASCVLVMRGAVEPPPPRLGVPRNPLVVATGAVAAVILGVGAVAEVALGAAEGSVLPTGLVVAAFAVAAAVPVLWLMTSSDEWPDRWRPPSQRRPHDGH